MSVVGTPDDPAFVRNSCGTKQRYSTEQLARDTAVRCWHERRVWLRAYACSVCGGWHLTRDNAPPMMKPGWRPPEKSQCQLAFERKQRRRRR